MVNEDRPVIRLTRAPIFEGREKRREGCAPQGAPWQAEAGIRSTPVCLSCARNDDH